MSINTNTPTITKRFTPWTITRAALITLTVVLIILSIFPYVKPYIIKEDKITAITIVERVTTEPGWSETSNITTSDFDSTIMSQNPQPESSEYTPYTVVYASYLNQDGIIFNNGTLGYATVKKYIDANGNSVIEYFYNKNGKLITRSGNYNGLARTYIYHEPTESYKNIEYSFLDEDGDIVEITSGYSTVKHMLDENGRAIMSHNYDVDGNKVASISGEYGVLREYDQWGRTIVNVYCDENDEPMETKNGSAYCIFVYPDNDTDPSELTEETVNRDSEYVWYYDLNNDPVEITRGAYGYRCDRELGQPTKYTPVDKNRKEVFKLTTILSDNMALIALVCVASLWILLYSGDKIRIAMLFACLLGIAYMTLLSRNADTSKVLEVFSSYKGFFTDETSRKEVIQNILLFVPLGAILMTLKDNKIISRLTKRMHPIAAITVIGFAISLIIELVQFFTGLGVFQIDDLVGNTLGTLIGAAAMHGLFKVKKT